MEFWYFNNYMVYFYEFLEKENGTNGTNDGSENPQESAAKQFASSMSNAKSLMKKPSGFKMPKK